MQVIAGHIDGPLVVQTALEVRGTVTGQVTVLPDAHLVLRGVCKGDVIIADGARAELWGIVEGDVGNQGGKVSIFGIVEGQLTRGAGETHLSSDSIVRGRGRKLASVDTSNPATDRHFKTGHHDDGLRLVIGSA